jgi:serine/threonine protein kinase
MSYCLNPHCSSPQKPDSDKFCSTCGFRLLLGDRYRAVRPIGRGGFGKTFLAVDEYKPSQPACVIKQFLPQDRSVLDFDRARELFRQEAMRLEQLGTHAQIPELLAHFEQAEYQYLVQEFIDGHNLMEEVMLHGSFSDRQVWQLLDDLLPVLEFIHHHQVIHRDIKPQNIIRRASTQ